VIRLLVACVTCGVLVAQDVCAQAEPRAQAAVDTPLDRAPPAPRVVPWATGLAPIAVENETRESAPVRLYRDNGEIDDEALMAFERVACAGGPSHRLSVRLVQLVLRAAYHFGGAAVVIVSGWRDHAGRHGTGDAIDFKLRGVRAARLAAYLRGMPRAGVGVYTHPRTQFVHLDVRDSSYHWIDASPPGIHWREAQLRDPHAAQRDTAWTPDMDLPARGL